MSKLSGARPASVASPAAIDRIASTRPAVRDPDIPTLSAALDPVELAREISLLSPSQWPWGEPLEIRVEVLRWRAGNNCTFEIVVRTESGLHPLIGKVYAADSEHVYRAMDKLRDAGFTREAETSIPQPIAYVPLLNLLLQEKVTGLAAKKIFGYGGQRLRAVAAERCARWLAQFHSLSPLSGPVRSVDKILARSLRAAGVVSEKGGLLANKAERLFDGLKAHASNLPTTPLRAGHGDFGSYHIVFADARTVTIDWDLYDLADPARDVARFIVSLERQALHRLSAPQAMDEATRLFLQTYLASGGSPVEVSLPFYKAAHCLKAAEWEVQAGDLQWRKWAEAMLDEGLRTLG